MKIDNFSKFKKMTNFLAIRVFLLLKEIYANKSVNRLICVATIDIALLETENCRKITIATTFCLATDTLKFQIEWSFF